MIKELTVRNFKCFQRQHTFQFASINLLTGVNGRGKSTLLQAMLLVAQTVRKKYSLAKLIINEEFVRLGNYDDIRNSETPRSENIEIKFKTDNQMISEVELKYNEEMKNPLMADLVELKVNGKDVPDIFEIDSDDLRTILFHFFTLFHYVSADRFGPIPYVEKTIIPDFLHVGANGEQTIGVLANSEDLPLVDDKLYLGKDSKSVIQQASEWLSYILDGGKIDIRGMDRESSVLYMLLNNKSNSYSYKPANVGFGYSYILPLIVTGLIAKRGEIVIVENPEAHLHPRAQSRITEFFAKVASNGVQMFIESHSEHILNGLRVCSVKPDIEITNKDISVIYFDENFGVKPLEIDSKGRIADWPTGFFDQQEIDLANLFQKEN